MDRILQNLHAPRRLNHDIEPVGIILLDLLEHGFRVRAAEGHVVVRGIQALGEVDLEALRRRDDDVTPAVLAQHLRQHEARRSRAEH